MTANKLWNMIGAYVREVAYFTDEEARDNSSDFAEEHLTELRKDLAVQRKALRAALTRTLEDAATRGYARGYNKAVLDARKR